MSDYRLTDMAYILKVFFSFWVTFCESAIGSFNLSHCKRVNGQ